MTDRTGGPAGDGAVIQITPAGVISTVASFDGSNGKFANPGLIRDANGNQFGETSQGGGTGAFGTVFAITNSGYVACFCDGTRIATEAGDVAVEQPRVGDRVLCHGGRSAPIVWIGHRRVGDADVSQRPVRIRAQSFGFNPPARDLYVSPAHALFIEGVLVPAMHLVDGDSIARVAIADITYWHVMLEIHDVILVEKPPVESFLADDDFDQFDNGADAERAHVFMEPCAPRITQGVGLEAIRARLPSFA